MTVPVEWKDTLLVHLLKVRFANMAGFADYRKGRSIPATFWDEVRFRFLFNASSFAS